MTLILGIDDAGRGPLIGLMILAGVVLTKAQEAVLKKAGAKDSKLLSHTERIRIGEIIKKNSVSNHIVKAYPEEIDSSIKKGINLNTLEAQKMAEAINSLNDGKKQIKVIVDCPSINVTKWREKLISFIKHSSNLSIACEHKADYNYVAVSAASILAKVAREEEMDKLRKKYKSYGDIGSGYPADPITQEFLKKNGKALADTGIFRKSWSTWKELFPDKKQKTLGEF